MDCSKCSLAHSSFQVKRYAVSVLSSRGWSISWKVCGIWRICACSLSRGGKRIWESRAEAGREMLICREGGQKRPHGRASGQKPAKELKTREAYDDSPSTAGQKKTSVQLSKHHRSGRRRQWTSLLQRNLSLLLLKHQRYPKTRRNNQKLNQRKTKKCSESRQKQRRHMECRVQAEARSALNHNRMCSRRNV